MRRNYLVRRLAVAALIIFATLTLNFFLFRAAPGSPLTNVSRVPNATPELIASVERQYGLDKPAWQQYFVYLRSIVSGDLGTSFRDSKPVVDKLAKAIGNTLPMILVGTLGAIAMGLATGLVAAWMRGSFADHASVGAALMFYALPPQWLGLMAITVTAGALPSGGDRDAFLVGASWLELTLDRVEHLILPAAVFALGLFGSFTLITRSAVLETLGDDFIRTARAKGLKPRTVMVRYGLRNALLPIVSLSALTLGYAVAGTIIIEVVFSWPGIGSEMYTAARSSDYPMLQGCFLVLTISVVLATLAADLLMYRLDPRLRS